MRLWAPWLHLAWWKGLHYHHIASEVGSCLSMIFFNQVKKLAIQSWLLRSFLLGTDVELDHSYNPVCVSLISYIMRSLLLKVISSHTGHIWSCCLPVLSFQCCNIPCALLASSSHGEEEQKQSFRLQRWGLEELRSLDVCSTIRGSRVQSSAPTWQARPHCKRLHPQLLVEQEQKDHQGWLPY